MSGFCLGVLVHHFGFSAIARKNISRIARKPDQLCLFAFQTWHSYLLIVFMAALGFALRQTHLSRPLLGGIYLIVGTGLTLSSTLYYREFM